MTKTKIGLTHWSSSGPKVIPFPRYPSIRVAIRIHFEDWKKKTLGEFILIIFMYVFETWYSSIIDSRFACTKPSKAEQE